MSTLSMQGNWKEVAGKLKQQYGNLTDDDVKLVEGREDELLGRLERKTGRTKEKVLDMLNLIRSF